MADQKREGLLPSPKVIVVAGKIGSGKSTALNNLYGLKLFTKSSPRPVTTTLSEHHVEKDGEPFVIVDTPGLGGIARSTESIIGDVATFLKGKDFTLLYCLPVKPSDTLTETDINTIKTIDSLLGRRVWDKCVLLLTFSDVAIEEFSSDKDMRNYATYLKSHADAFYDQFEKCGIKLPPIMIVSDYEGPMLQRESTGQIIAVPVKRDKEGGPLIIPGINVEDNQDWAERAVEVTTNTSRLIKRKEPGKWYDVVIKYPVRSVTGTLVGAGLGAFFGSFSGPWGSVIGAFIGAAVGIALAIASVLATKSRSRKLSK